LIPFVVDVADVVELVPSAEVTVTAGADGSDDVGLSIENSYGF
jgi:hypothetical protein